MMADESVLIRLFGSVEVLSSDGWRRGGPSKQACVLASLALAARTPVGIDVLAHRIWGGDPPAGMRNVIYGHITRLRRLLDEHDVELRRVGRSEYQLDVASDQVDVLRARTLAAEAREEQRHGEAARAVEHWRLAADLWRGPALAGINGAWAVRTARKLRDEHVAVLAGLSECELLLGRYEAVVSRLETAVDEYPLAENLIEPLMIALYRSGRVSEALDRYEDSRRRLREQLGNDPGQRLRDLQRRILRQDPDLLTVSDVPDHRAAVSDRTTGAGSPGAIAVPAQLPAGLSGFVGREQAIATLDSLVTGDDVPIATISGMAGIGKTALAVYWAHRVAGSFPDGQLYVNLRGFDPSDQPVEPAEALRGLLYALGVPPERVPPGHGPQLGLFRTMLAGRHLLLVLDNARDEEQVRSLLPGAPGCLVLVTSRNRLPGLVTTHGARPLLLDLFSTDEAHRLLERRVGAERLAAEPEATRATVEQSGRLPLALAVVAARAVTLPKARIAGLAHELRSMRSTLDRFATTDETTDMRAVFSWSYRLLGEPAARLFRLIGLHPGPDISVDAAVSLAGADESSIRKSLAELAGAHLLTEQSPGRYACHDLLRAYAAELVTAAADDRRAATLRMVQHYAHSARVGALLLNPARDLDEPGPRSPGVTVWEPRTLQAALDWFHAEHSVLLSVLELAVAAELNRLAWLLATAMVTFLDRQGYWHELVSTQRTAVTCARLIDDRPALARAHGNLGRAYGWLRRFDEAIAELHHALRLYRDAGDASGQARIHQQLGVMLANQDRREEAIEQARLALTWSEVAGDDTAAAFAHNSLGWNLAQLGRYDEALGPCERALRISRGIGRRAAQAAAWDSLGYINHHLAEQEQALSCYQQAIEVRRQLGDRRGEATSLTGFGDVEATIGDTVAAVAAWQRALEIYDDLGHPDADAVRVRLRSMCC